MQPAEVLDLFRRTGAMLEGHFVLSSGLHSDRYFQCALLLSYPEHAERLAQALVLGIEDEIDVVVGPALGAVVWQHEVARALGCRGLFTEREAGEMVLRRGFRLEPGERVLVVEDVLTTGGSVREVLEVVGASGASAVGVGAILNRSGGNPFADIGLPLFALVEVEAKVFEPARCPLCAEGRVAVKPGSRPGASRAGGSVS